jgi:hypothetical protein
MDAQEVSAYLECLRKVYLVLVFCVVLLDFHTGDYCRTEGMKDSTCPYFLENVLVFLGVKCLEA